MTPNLKPIEPQEAKEWYLEKRQDELANAISRVRRKIKNKLMIDVDALRENHPDLYAKL